jgi:hypothetical protein
MNTPIAHVHTEAMLVALERLRGAGAEFGGFLANHGPMAADAIIRLGGEDRVEAWIDHYRIELEPAPPSGSSVTSDNWQDELGRIERLGDWNGYFHRQLSERPWQEVLASWWPRLLPGAAASATHGVIRVAHAVRNLAEHDHAEHGDAEALLVKELGAGLSYWAARHQVLPGSPELTGPLSLTEAVTRLPRLDPTVLSDGPGIGGRLRSLVRLRGLPEALDGWGPDTVDEAALDQLVSCSARMLLSRRDAQIAYCHAVTAPAAIRMILPALPADQHRATIAAAWQMAAAIISAFDSPWSATETVDQLDERILDPAQLAAAALEHGDEHVIKLTEACLRQYELTADATLLAAAGRFQDRIAPRW